MLQIKINGLDQFNKNLDRIYNEIRAAARDGMDYGLEETVNYIKDEFVFNKTGRGFNDVTGNLRNSIGKVVDENPRKVRGFVRAGMNYALAVETRREGRNAFLYPGVQDKKADIAKSIADAVEAVLK